MKDIPGDSSYIILKCEDIEDLETKVNALIKEGWLPLGGATMNSIMLEPRCLIYYIQTMVK